MNVRRIAFVPRKPLKKLCSSNCLFSRSYFQHSESFSTIFPSLKHNVIQIYPSSSLPFSRYSKIANGTKHTHIITPSLTFTCATALFQAGKHSSDSAVYASSSKNSAVLQSVGETIWLVKLVGRCHFFYEPAPSSFRAEAAYLPWLTPWRWRQHVLPKPCYPATKVYGGTFQQTIIWRFTDLRTVHLTNWSYAPRLCNRVFKTCIKLKE